VRADQTTFTNQGDCVSYAARGGVLTSPKSASQLLCEKFGGTFAVGSGGVLWTCDGRPDAGGPTANFFALAAACLADGGQSYESSNPPPHDTCSI
jgi:hypothetical protein